MRQHRSFCWLQIGDHDRILGDFDASQIDEAKVSSVQYVKFPISDDEQEELEKEGTVVRIRPSSLSGTVGIERSEQESIVEDLAAEDSLAFVAASYALYEEGSRFRMREPFSLRSPDGKGLRMNASRFQQHGGRYWIRTSDLLLVRQAL